MNATRERAIPTQVRNGDVLLLKMESLPEGASQKRMQYPDLLAEGEVTGHAHRIVGGGLVERYDHAGQAYVLLKQPGILTHEEHGEAPLEPGVYELIIERDYDPSAYAVTVRE